MKKNEPISNVEVVIYVLTILGGTDKTVHTEDIAAKAYELSPVQFSWVKKDYRTKGWPDKEVARLALEDAKKPKYGALVEGAHNREITKDGWRLTPAGVMWVKNNQPRISKLLGIKSNTGVSSISSKEKSHFLAQIRKQPLYIRFSKKGRLEEAKAYEFTDMLNCSSDASKEIIAFKFNRLINKAYLVDDKGILEFLESCKGMFCGLLSETENDE